MNATGVWADRIRPEELHGEEDEDVPVIRPSRGTHILLDRERLPMNAAAVVPAGEDRTIFALPWLGQTLVGTTDNDYEGSLEHPPVSGGGRATTCWTRSTRSSRRDFGPGDLAGAYAGVRPLISAGDPKKSVDISRKAELYETSSGMITITGGKLTTWRRMAKMMVDRLVEREFREAPCRTHEIPLGHPVDPATLAGGRRCSTSARASTWRAATGCSPSSVLALCAEHAGAGAADRRGPARPAGRGGRGRAPRAGARRRGRAAAAHAARACSRAAALVEDARRRAPGREGDGAGARMGQARSEARGRGVARGGAGSSSS